MVRNILAVIAGWFVGSIVNFALIMANMAIMPPGTDFSTPEGVNAAMANLQPLNFALVFIAHAVGTLIGALVATLIAVDKFKVAMVVGVLFLLGGFYAAYAIAAPLWFEVIDIVLAYVPMAWLGAKLSGAGKNVRV
jgi:hypothetical protein